MIRGRGVQGATPLLGGALAHRQDFGSSGSISPAAVSSCQLGASLKLISQGIPWTAAMIPKYTQYAHLQS